VLIVFEEEEKSSSTFLKKLTALALIALLPIGATLASNISLGNNSAVEFGQGVKKLVTCAPNVPIFLKPRNTFVNSAGTGAHYKFTGISIEGIQNTCVGFDFVIRAYGESGSPLPIFDTNKTEIRIYQSLGDAFSTNASDGITFSNVAFGQFVATFDAPVSASTEVYRITIETFPHDTSMLRYAVGDTGPAGGYIFLTPNSAGNNTGLYFEAKNHGGGEIWCDQYPANVTAATGSSIGTGDANTSAINSICNDGAAFEARYWAGSPNDWYLPSTGELSAVFAAGFIPTFGANYWTSTQYDEVNAYVVTWPGQAVNVTDKIMGNPLVAVRSFS
jgi:hypothetical protein